MISDIVLTGRLKNIISKNKKFRIIETTSEDVLNGKTIVSEIPILFWTREENNLLNRIPDDTFVIIRGRLESNKSIGLYVLVEHVQLGDSTDPCKA